MVDKRKTKSIRVDGIKRVDNLRWVEYSTKAGTAKTLSRCGLRRPTSRKEAEQPNPFTKCHFFEYYQRNVAAYIQHPTTVLLHRSRVSEKLKR